MNKTQVIVPGPGRYQPSTVDLISRNDAPKYGFGTSTRADIGGGMGGNIHQSKRTLSVDGKESATRLKPLNPGPGAYEIKGILGTEGPKRSLAARFKIDLDAKELGMKPGPGAYTPVVNLAVKASPNYKIGTSLREKYYLKDKYKHELPPPNIYNPNFEKTRMKAPATGLGYGERSVMNKTLNSPGPGTYQHPTSIGEGPTYILGARLFDSYETKKNKEQPSPFQYSPNFDVLSKTQSVFSIGKALRDDVTGPRRLNVPGPGTYIGPKPQMPNFKDAPKWGFGSSERPDIGAGKTKAVPGPGTYRLKSTFADVPAYLIPNQQPSYV